jgi:hypothetical protein
VTLFAMVRHYSLAVLILAAAATSSAQPGKPEANVAAIDGEWRFEYSCIGATGMYADRCSAGERDDFTISVEHAAGKLRGSYELTAQLGNHVDDGDISNWSFVAAGPHTYRVHFQVSGATGDAIIKVRGNKLLWRTIAEHRENEQVLQWLFSPPQYRSSSTPEAQKVAFERSDPQNVYRRSVGAKVAYPSLG